MYTQCIQKVFIVLSTYCYVTSLFQNVLNSYFFHRILQKIPHNAKVK